MSSPTRNCRQARLVLCDLKFSPDGKCTVRKYLMTNAQTGVKVRPHRTLWPAKSPRARTLDAQDVYADTLDAFRKMSAWWDTQLKTRASGVGDTVCGMVEAWIMANRARWAASTVPKYRANLRLHIRPRLGGLKIAECKPYMIDDLLDQLGEEGQEGGRPLSPNTIRGVYQNLKSAFDWGMVMGWAAGNPLNYVAKPKPDRYVAEFLRKEQVRALEDELDRVMRRNPEFYDAKVRNALFGAWLSLRTGLRLGEICALRLSDVWRDLMTGDARGVLVSGTVTEAGGLRRLDRPKSASSNRKVPLFPEYARELEQHVVWTSELPGVPAGDRPLLAVSADYMRPSYVSSCFSTLRDELGFPEGITFHSLRHTYASIHLAINTPVVDLARYMGHASPDVTQRIYAHVMRAEGAEDARAYARALEQMGAAR